MRSHAFLLHALVVVAGSAVVAQVPRSTDSIDGPVPLAALWENPVNLRDRDLFNGPWGPALAPDPRATYTFVRRKDHGANPGVIVRDGLGRTWHVKQPDDGHGAEGPVEVVLSRVLSAVGYHQPPVYFLSSFTMTTDAGSRATDGGRFRLDEPSMHHRSTWSWQDNPLMGTRPYNGLLVILLMFNSWDLKDSNNTLYDVRRGDRIEPWYVVRDLGGALGEDGGLVPKRNDIDKFERHKFITGVKGNFVHFSYRGKQPSLVSRRITVDDVRWASDLMAGLTDRQWHDAFRAGGYSPSVSERFIGKIRTYIAQGQQLTSATALAAEGQ